MAFLKNIRFSTYIRKLVIPVSALLMVLIYTLNNLNQPKNFCKSTVDEMNVNAIVALGRLEPEGEVIKVSVSNAQDSRVNQILVKEGDFVQANQVVAILQGIESRQADLKDALADVRLRQAELAKVEQGDVKNAEIAAQRAVVIRLEAQLETETMQRKAAVASAEAVLREAQLTYQRRQSLFTQGAISQADADTAQRDVATAQANLAQRQAELQQTLKTLKAEIAEERAELAELLEVLPLDVEIAQAQLEKATIAVQQMKANLADAEVRVPIAGQILRINTRIGEQVNTTQGIVELAQTDRMFAIAEVSETDIGKVLPGQRATITSQYGSFTGEIYGTVEQIGLQIGTKSFPEKVVDNTLTKDNSERVVEVKVRIDFEDNPKIATLTNMQVQVKLDVSKNASFNMGDY
jgi:HlyD family secretion protein